MGGGDGSWEESKCALRIEVSQRVNSPTLPIMARTKEKEPIGGCKIEIGRHASASGERCWGTCPEQ